MSISLPTDTVSRGQITGPDSAPTAGQTSAAQPPPRAWSLPAGVDLKGRWDGFASIEARLKSMVQNAIQVKGGIKALSGLRETLAPAGRNEEKKFKAVEKAQAKAQGALAKLDKHPASDFVPVGKNSPRAVKKAYQAALKDLLEAVKPQ